MNLFLETSLIKNLNVTKSTARVLPKKDIEVQVLYLCNAQNMVGKCISKLLFWFVIMNILVTSM